MADSRKRISKFLSLVLRHQPDVIGLKLDEQGWARVDELIERVNHSGEVLTRQELDIIVAENDKKRFIFSDDGLRIRANQGHSIAVDLQLKEAVPPEWLYHGTAVRFLDSIREQGLVKGQRQQVHLSADAHTAKNVGSRHGKPVVLTVKAGAMHRDGLLFYQSENGVWLTDHVPPVYLLNEDPSAH